MNIGNIQPFIDYFEYIPLFLLSLLLVADNELDKQIFHVSCKMIMMMIVFFVFFALTLYLEKSRTLAVLVTGILWVVLLRIKRRIM
jgi:hypothetical protein